VQAHAATGVDGCNQYFACHIRLMSTLLHVISSTFSLTGPALPEVGIAAGHRT
jgi:hypothetical protein